MVNVYRVQVFVEYSSVAYIVILIAYSNLSNFEIKNYCSAQFLSLIQLALLFV